MKYLYYFKDINESNVEQSNNDFNVIFENENWKIETANSFEALDKWSEDGDINMSSYKRNFSDIFLNTNKKTDDKLVFDFDRSDFYTLEDDNVELKELLDDNVELFNFYGENLKCEWIVKDGNDYWLVVNDYPFFEDYFKVGHNTRNDLIKTVLSGDVHDLFEYQNSSFSIDDDMDLTKDNLDLIKIILALELIANDYDYDIDDISDYSDAVDIIKENDMEDLKDMLLDCIRDGHESADESAAWKDVIDEIYSFFEFEENSIKWDYYNNSKNQMLWAKFKTPIDAYKAKFTIMKYDDSFEDDVIDYSPPHYGYNGSTKDMNETFNERLIDKTYEYDSGDVSSDDIEKSYDIFKEQKEGNPEIQVSDIIENLKLFLNTKKFNI